MNNPRKPALPSDEDCDDAPAPSDGRPDRFVARQEIDFAAPGKVLMHRAGEAWTWLGFRLGPSRWPGYFRIGLSSDSGANAATIDVHYSEFPRLVEAIHRLGSGAATGMHFNTPAESITPRGRAVVGALLLRPAPPQTVIEVLDLDYEPLLTAKALMPDVKRGFEACLPLLFSVGEGPPRRALRRFESAEEALMPKSWDAPGVDIHAIVRAQMESRRTEHYSDVKLTYTSAPARVRGALVTATGAAFDFTDWPALAAIDTRTSHSVGKTEIVRVTWPDVATMRRGIDDELIPLRAGGGTAIYVPPDLRETFMRRVEELYGELETSFFAAMRRVPRTRPDPLTIPLFRDLPPFVGAHPGGPVGAADQAGPGGPGSAQKPSQYQHQAQTGPGPGRAEFIQRSGTENTPVVAGSSGPAVVQSNPVLSQ